MAALPMPHEIGLETERLLSTAWDLATVTPIVPPVVVFTVRHVSALHRYKTSLNILTFANRLYQTHCRIESSGRLGLAHCALVV